MILNLDTHFKPFGINNEIKFKAFTFNGGEPHIKILSSLNNVDEITITHRIKSFNDFGLLLLAIDAVQRQGVEHISVFVPYFPGARQDRIMTSGEPLTVKVYADILNNYNLKEVIVFDVHSDVTPALLSRCKTINNFSFIKKVVSNIPNNNLVLISPDGGALKKIYALATYLENIPVIECSKVRDIKTGKLSNFNVYADNLKGKTCLIVDDICDGGGTFIGIGKALKEKQADKLYLAVSHGIFSKGFDLLNTYFEHIYTTNSFRNITSEKLTQIPIKMS